MVKHSINYEYHFFKTLLFIDRNGNCYAADVQDTCIQQINDLRVPLDGASCAREVRCAGKFQSQNAESIELLFKDQSFNVSKEHQRSGFSSSLTDREGSFVHQSR